MSCSLEGIGPGPLTVSRRPGFFTGSVELLSFIAPTPSTEFYVGISPEIEDTMRVLLAAVAAIVLQG